MGVRKQNRQLGSMSYAAEIKIIYKTEGLKGFLRGYQGMMIRDAPGFAIYFSMYETMKRYFGVDDGSHGTEQYAQMADWKKKASLMVSGGLAGIVTWVASFPA